MTFHNRPAKRLVNPLLALDRTISQAAVIRAATWDALLAFFPIRVHASPPCDELAKDRSVLFYNYPDDFVGRPKCPLSC